MATSADSVLVSVVVPVYGNRTTLEALHARIEAALARRCGSFEIVYVNDASPDESSAVLDGLAAHDPRVRVVDLMENVGQHRAILVGLGAARGEVAIAIDADLQDPPEAMPLLLDRLDEGYDVVFAGRRGDYHDSALSRVTSRVFKHLQSRLIDLPADAGSYVALRRPVVERVLAMPPGRQTVVAMIGFASTRTTSVPIQRQARPVGRSAFSFADRMSLAFGTLVWAARMRFTGRSR